MVTPPLTLAEILVAFVLASSVIVILEYLDFKLHFRVRIYGFFILLLDSFRPSLVLREIRMLFLTRARGARRKEGVNSVASVNSQDTSRQISQRV